MIYLDNGATSFPKPDCINRAMSQAMDRFANPGRGGYPASEMAARMVFRCREQASALFACRPEQVVFTSNCTHGLNIAIRSLVKSGSRVVISGFEHNAVTRPLHLLGAKITVAGRKLFDPEDTLHRWEEALRQGADAAVFTHVSNVFGYILPVREMAALCRRYGVPFILDAAQSAGSLDVHMDELGADFIAMPGHKGLLGPQGTGILLCAAQPEPLMAGGTGSASLEQQMPEYLPDRLEPGTLNVPGIAGLSAGLQYLQNVGIRRIFKREHALAMTCAGALEELGLQVFTGPWQAATVSLLPRGDCETVAEQLGKRGIALRAGLHCAPLAHESAGTLKTGTLRVSFGHSNTPEHIAALKQALQTIRG